MHYEAWEIQEEGGESHGRASRSTDSPLSLSVRPRGRNSITSQTLHPSSRPYTMLQSLRLLGKTSDQRGSSGSLRGSAVEL
ncbi:uncharacterized protein SPSK_10822 [Sporothrix schenckii 1099-18]|uniref:Uncharacterized protein n=1 Tax=Sporothrix schenckii 1099-18 TaxID=1397361 RepID=A0A0F2MG62_SPOSC|nr:uncharacterized protein SPSK_10822 [Sporothrix schenckii 1099-18]KJR88688.1 hypothetical protein SPSK_10822 [Sporothrix schenckii 1099-18]